MNAQEIINLAKETQNTEYILKCAVDHIACSSIQHTTISIDSGSPFKPIIQEMINENDSFLLRDAMRRLELKVLEAKRAELFALGQRAQEIENSIEEKKTRRYYVEEKTRSATIEIPEDIPDDDIEEYIINQTLPNDILDRWVVEEKE